MKTNYELTESEEKLAELIWREAPILSPNLVALALREMNWKKSTTYTMLMKLRDKGVVRNDNALVTVLLTRDELATRQSRDYIIKFFGGSLPKFITSFIGPANLTHERANEIKKMIDEFVESGGNR